MGQHYNERLLGDQSAVVRLTTEMLPFSGMLMHPPTLDAPSWSQSQRIPPGPPLVLSEWGGLRMPLPSHNLECLDRALLHLVVHGIPGS
jgi:hypothetical protein